VPSRVFERQDVILLSLLREGFWSERLEATFAIYCFYAT
jgi:hypothetical protein